MQQLKSAISTWSIKSNFVFPVTRLIRNQRAYGAAAAQIPIDDEKQNSSEKTQKQESKFDKILGDFARREQERKDNHLKSLSKISEMNNLASDPTQRLRKIEATQVYWRRRFKPGETYEPEDLSDLESQRKRGRQRQPVLTSDIFNEFQLDVNNQYKNVPLLSQFVNDIGQVIPCNRSGLTKQNHRKLVRTINRAVVFGIIPRTKKHWSTVRN